MNTRLLTLSLLACVVSAAVLGDDNWPQFRGHGGSGIGSGGPPTEWNPQSGHNIAWKTPIAGLGHSAPIAWGDRVFLTTAVNSETDRPSLETGWSGGTGESAKDTGQWSWQVICLQLDTGDILWTKDAHVGEPKIKRHLKASHANCTPATDGKYVVAFFGSEGLYCYDVDGHLVWKHDFGELRSGPYDAPELEWGFASSPIIHDGHVIVQCDCLNTNFVAILDITTGQEVLRIDRDGEVATWSTPLVVTTEDRLQIVCNGYHQMAGYDFRTGTRLWHLSDGGDVPVPAPLFANGLIYLTNGHGRSPTYAILPNATGDLTPRKGETSDEVSDHPGLAWWQPRDGSYMPTPLVKDDLLYTCNDNGRLAVRNAVTGELIYRERVGKGSTTFSASAVAAGGHVYFASERGEVTVIEEGDSFQELATNEMGEVVMATPAISGDRLLIRTVANLYCITTIPIADQVDNDE
ncbi:MAG: PQQ-binding-like beta-propeller repeat protein [Planctomycetaceae bacterium]|nr:PQQ-binding-like beta-propeller repeat protein [Planctomycetaceae bacterium]